MFSELPRPKISEVVEPLHEQWQVSSFGKYPTNVTATHHYGQFWMKR